jgi:hypothetical protein
MNIPLGYTLLRDKRVAEHCLGTSQIARRAGILQVHYLIDSARKQHIHLSSRGKLIG